MDDDQKNIQEAEIVEEDIPQEEAEKGNTSPTKPSGGASEMMNLESLIKQYVANMEVVKNNLKTQKEMFEDAFNNDETYRKHAEAAKEANKTKNETRAEILKIPSVAALSEKVKDLRFELKDMEASLADYLSQYQEVSGATQIELPDGTVMEIINVPKLVKKGY